jgi:hypothetical protein
MRVLLRVGGWLLAGGVLGAVGSQMVPSVVARSAVVLLGGVHPRADGADVVQQGCDELADAHHDALGATRRSTLEQAGCRHDRYCVAGLIPRCGWSEYQGVHRHSPGAGHLWSV